MHHIRLPFFTRGKGEKLQLVTRTIGGKCLKPPMQNRLWTVAIFRWSSGGQRLYSTRFAYWILMYIQHKCCQLCSQLKPLYTRYRGRNQIYHYPPHKEEAHILYARSRFTYHSWICLSLETLDPIVEKSTISINALISSLYPLKTLWGEVFFKSRSSRIHLNPILGLYPQRSFLLRSPPRLTLGFCRHQGHASPFKPRRRGSDVHNLSSAAWAIL